VSCRNHVTPPTTGDGKSMTTHPISPRDPSTDDATDRSVRDAVCDWLSNPIPDDRVLAVFRGEEHATIVLRVPDTVVDRPQPVVIGFDDGAV